MMHRLFNLIYNKLYSIKFVYTIYHFFRTTIPNYFDSDRLQKFGYKDLNYFNAIMKENEIEYFCDFGTLLGIVRENSFIKHDIDIDVALIRGKQFDIKKIEQILTNKGLKKTHEYYYCGRVTEESYIFPSGVSIDLFIYDLEDDVMSTYVYYKDHSTVYPDSSFRSVKKLVYPKIDKFKTINFVDCETIIPYDAELRLTAIYGPTWNVPDKSYKPDREENIMSDYGIALKYER